MKNEKIESIENETKQQKATIRDVSVGSRAKGRVDNKVRAVSFDRLGCISRAKHVSKIASLQNG